VTRYKQRDELPLKDTEDGAKKNHLAG